MKEMRLTRGEAVSTNVTAISSKSYVHRLIIAAALYSKEPVTVVTNIMSADMEATVRVICALGGLITTKTAASGEYEITVAAPLGAKIITHAVLDCGESGSTARFVLPFASLFADEAVITGSGRLPERPMEPLCDVMSTAGVFVSAGKLPITVRGKMRPGRYEIAGNVSSQYISGLLFALPLLGGSSVLSVTGTFESAAYVDMTVDVLKKFGANIKRSGNDFYIDPPGPCPGHAMVYAEGDWSNAAYIMAIAALSCGRSFDSLTIDGLDPDSIQGDRAVAGIMKEFGVEERTVRSADGSSDYVISGNPVKPVDVDCSQIPDLVPALAVVAAYAGGESIFRNVGRLRMKECDRIEAVTSLLAAVDVKVDITSHDGVEDMTVYGKGGNSPAVHEITVDSFNDHRIAMAACALAAAEPVPVVIKDPMAVNKSYPGFYDVIEKLGIVRS